MHSASNSLLFCSNNFISASFVIISSSLILFFSAFSLITTSPSHFRYASSITCVIYTVPSIRGSGIKPPSSLGVNTFGVGSSQLSNLSKNVSGDSSSLNSRALQIHPNTSISAFGNSDAARRLQSSLLIGDDVKNPHLQPFSPL